MPATRRKLNTIPRLRVAAASPETETSSSSSSDTQAIETGTTDVAPVTSVDAADNVSKVDHAAEEEAVGDGKEE
jgi:hypothetical protein